MLFNENLALPDLCHIALCCITPHWGSMMACIWYSCTRSNFGVWIYRSDYSNSQNYCLWSSVNPHKFWEMWYGKILTEIEKSFRNYEEMWKSLLKLKLYCLTKMNWKADIIMKIILKSSKTIILLFVYFHLSLSQLYTYHQIGENVKKCWQNERNDKCIDGIL